VIEDHFTRGPLLAALQAAALVLARPACQAVLSDFTAQDGRPVRARLDELGAGPDDYLQLLFFRDGAERGRCRGEFVMAFTVPSSRVVYVCGRRFESLWWRDRAAARAVVIHEALHTLGLGENPPSSAEITSRVHKRCR